MSARAPRHLKVMYFRAAYNLPITLGLEHGVFARHGLDLEITYTYCMSRRNLRGGIHLRAR